MIKFTQNLFKAFNDPTKMKSLIMKPYGITVD